MPEIPSRYRANPKGAESFYFSEKKSAGGFKKKKKLIPGLAQNKTPPSPEQNSE